MAKSAKELAMEKANRILEEMSEEELDKVKLLFDDPDTYHRLMKEYQRAENAK